MGRPPAGAGAFAPAGTGRGRVLGRNPGPAVEAAGMGVGPEETFGASLAVFALVTGSGASPAAGGDVRDLGRLWPPARMRARRNRSPVERGRRRGPDCQ